MAAEKEQIVATSWQSTQQNGRLDTTGTRGSRNADNDRELCLHIAFPSTGSKYSSLTALLRLGDASWPLARHACPLFALPQVIDEPRIVREGISHILITKYYLVLWYASCKECKMTRMHLRSRGKLNKSNAFGPSRMKDATRLAHSMCGIIHIASV